ncbi:MAG: glycosyltransferase family A protein [Alphaproteobacteria bacterium]
MSNLPSTSVVVVTHRRPDGLREMLGSLASARVPPTLAEVLVIENGDPGCGSREVAAAATLPVPVHWTFIPKSSISVSRNAGVVAAEGEFIIFFDDDVRVGIDTPAAYVAAAAFGPQHFFGGPLEVRQDVAPPDWLNEFLPNSARGWSLGAERQIVRKPVFLGANLAAFKSDILAAGGFPEYLGGGLPYRVGGEETFLQVRMLDKGLQGVFVPEASVQHHVPAERCTPAFALDRYFNYEVTFRIAHHIENRIRPGRLPPRWVWRKFLTAYVRAVLKRIQTPDLKARFQSELDLRIARAYFAAHAIMARYRLYDRYGKHASENSQV